MPPYSPDDLLPLSALNDLLFCERRCALHRSEQVWIDNSFTLEGTFGHKRVHAEPSVEDLGLQGRIVRGLRLASSRLGLSGIADLVELRATPGGDVGYPVEYKRGRRRRWNNDDVQLCAQALCIEEMLALAVPAGAIYHLKSRRRREVVFDDKLRALTETAARRLHELVASGETPPPVLKPRCRGCSLIDLCLPTALSNTGQCQTYQRQLYEGMKDEGG